MRQYIKIVRDHNEWRRGADTEMTDVRLLGISLEQVAKGAERYELVRTLNPFEFQALTDKNIAGGGKFDDLVDELIAKRAI